MASYYYYISIRDARGDLDRCTDGIRGGDDGRRLVAPDVLPIVHGERKAARGRERSHAHANGTSEPWEREAN